jgi:hypothetical protein
MLFIFVSMAPPLSNQKRKKTNFIDLEA